MSIKDKETVQGVVGLVAIAFIGYIAWDVWSFYSKKEPITLENVFHQKVEDFTMNNEPTVTIKVGEGWGEGQTSCGISLPYSAFQAIAYTDNKGYKSIDGDKWKIMDIQCVYQDNWYTHHIKGSIEKFYHLTGDKFSYEGDLFTRDYEKHQPFKGTITLDRAALTAPLTEKQQAIQAEAQANERKHQQQMADLAEKSKILEDKMNAYSDKKRQGVVDYFKSNKMPFILDAHWIDDEFLAVAVLNTGKPQTELAQNICITLKELELNINTTVSVVDVDNPTSPPLGVTNCFPLDKR